MFDSSRSTRRRIIKGGVAAAVCASPLWQRALRAQTAAEVEAALPLTTTGLEHLGTLVPDVAKAGEFYARVFSPELHKEREGALRYYVPFDIGYVAIGAAGDRPPEIDHYCALVESYDRAALAARLEREGMESGRLGMIPDPDGIRLQLLAAPGGLAASTISAGRIFDGDAIFDPVGLDHVLLRVSSVERALPFYRLFFGKETSGDGSHARFEVALTSLRLEQTSGGAAPGIARYCVRVRAFDRAEAARGLTALTAEILVNDGRLLRFTDPDGIEVEVIPIS